MLKYINNYNDHNCFVNTNSKIDILGGFDV